MPRVTRVLLGPADTFHLGIFQSLLASPPEGVSYLARDPVHIFFLPPGAPSPHGSFHWGEFVDFGPGEEIVHSQHWPVLGRLRWVMETGEFGYPILCGRRILDPALQASLGQTWPAGLRNDIRARARAMMRGLAHDSCLGVIFRTQEAIDEAAKWIDCLGIQPEGDRLLAKSCVIHPACPPIGVDAVRRKWEQPAVPQIVFCGRDFAVKNGRLALSVLGELLKQPFPLRLVYIGPIPDEQRSKFKDVLARIEHHPSLSPEQVRAIFVQSHILFHPSLAENFGVVLAEACATGQAIVAAESPALAHLKGLFGEGAVLVNRVGRTPAEEAADYVRIISLLCHNPALAYRLAMKNFALCTTGTLSIPFRNQRLRGLYERWQERTPAEPLREDALGLPAGATRRRLSSIEVTKDQDSFQQSVNASNAYVLVSAKQQRL